MNWIWISNWRDVISAAMKRGGVRWTQRRPDGCSQSDGCRMLLLRMLRVAGVHPPDAYRPLSCHQDRRIHQDRVSVMGRRHHVTVARRFLIGQRVSKVTEWITKFINSLSRKRSSKSSANLHMFYIISIIPTCRNCQLSRDRTQTGIGGFNDQQDSVYYFWKKK